MKSRIRGIFRGVKGIKALEDHIKKKKHDKAVKASKGAHHANNIQQAHQRRMLEEDDELVGTESEGEFSDDELYRQNIDAFIERYLDNKFVVAILKNLAEEEVSKSA